MKKEKLKQARIQKGISQDQMAEVICRDKSAYCRKENGQVKITISEWEKIAKFLNLDYEDIYEVDLPEDYLGRDQNNSVPLAFVEHLHDYIQMLKSEIEKLNLELSKK